MWRWVEPFRYPWREWRQGNDPKNCDTLASTRISTYLAPAPALAPVLALAVAAAPALARALALSPVLAVAFALDLAPALSVAPGS